MPYYNPQNRSRQGMGSMFWRVRGVCQANVQRSGALSPQAMGQRLPPAGGRWQSQKGEPGGSGFICEGKLPAGLPKRILTQSKIQYTTFFACGK